MNNVIFLEDLIELIKNFDSTTIAYIRNIFETEYGLGILNYDSKLSYLIENKAEIMENSDFEVEIRSCMLIVINYMYKKIDKKINRIDINDFIWNKGQDKSVHYSPYHLTRTKSY